MPPAPPPWPAPDAPAAAPGPTTRAPAAPPSRAGPPPRRAPAPPPSTPRPRDWSTARRPPAAPPAGAAAGRAAPASGSSVSSRCPVAGRRARPDPRRCTAPAASRPTAPRTRSSRPPRPPRDPSPAARSPGRAGPSGRPPRRGTAPPAPPRSSVPPPPPRIRLPQAKAPGYRLRHPAGTITEHISRKPYQTARWDWFGRTLSLEHFRDYVERIPAEERRRWTDRAIATAEERHQEVGSALRFLTRIDETEAAERLVLARAEEIDGHLYFVLRPVAEALAPAHPLGAVILYRAMASAVLGAARSKSYGYAASELLQAGQLAGRVTDWNGLPDHAEFVRRLRQEHGRKYSFWPLLGGQ